MRLPGAALLITIGLFILWLAATGNLDRLGKAWDFVRGKSDLPATGSNASPAASRIHDFSTFHVETHLTDPIGPGGFN